MIWHFGVSYSLQEKLVLCFVETCLGDLNDLLLSIQ